METGALVDLISYLVVAVVVYALLVSLAFWQIPRRRHWIPGSVVSFAGALLGAVVVAALWPTTPLFGELFAAALGAVGFVYTAVKVGTPGSVVLTINCEIDTAHESELKGEGFEPPFVWPYHMAVEKYGSVIWELCGREGTVVVVEFPEDNSPFGNDAKGRPKSTFKGTVPGRIVASPTVRPSRGEYKVIKTDPNSGASVVGDPSWDIPRRKD